MLQGRFEFGDFRRPRRFSLDFRALIPRTPVLPVLPFELYDDTPVEDTGRLSGELPAFPVRFLCCGFSGGGVRIPVVDESVADDC